MRAVVVLVALWGCRPDFEIDDGPPAARGAAPLADAGIGSTVRVATPITLDGSNSMDPDGTITAYYWFVTSAPDASGATIAANDVAVTSFVPDVTGTYTFELEVFDDDGNVDRSEVTHTVIALPLTVDAGPDAMVEWRKAVQLAGTVAVESSEQPTLAWTLISKPSRSAAALQNATTLTPSFVADAAGTYVLELSATTSKHAHSDFVSIVAAAQTVAFQGAFIDAVFSSDDEMDFLVAISDSPPRVRLIKPTNGTEKTFALPSTPTAIAMDQYHAWAAVSTAGQIHIFDLFAQQLIASHSVPFTAARLVYGPFQLVHAYTAQAGPIQTLNLENGTVTASAFSVPAGSTAMLQPTFAMYGIETSATPALVNYSLSNAPVTRDRTWPYTTQYALGTQLWVWANRITTELGHVFEASHLTADDMQYVGQLGGDAASVVHSFGYNPNLVTLHAVATGTQPNHQLRRYDATTLAQHYAAPLPEIVINGTPQPSTGRLIAYSPSYPQKIVIVASTGTSNVFFVTQP